MFFAYLHKEDDMRKSSIIHKTILINTNRFLLEDSFYPPTLDKIIHFI